MLHKSYCCKPSVERLSSCKLEGSSRVRACDKQRVRRCLWVAPYVQKFHNFMPEYYVCGFIFPNCVSKGSLLKIFPSNSNLCIYILLVLTVQDIIISNPFKSDSAGVIELEIVVLNTGRGSINKLQTTCTYIFMYIVCTHYIHCIVATYLHVHTYRAM